MLFDKNSKIYDVLIDGEISLNEYSRQKGFELSVEKEAESFCREKELVYVNEDSVLKQEVIEQSPNPAKSEKRAFISYSFRDKNIADNLCFKLESNGLPVWYAPRDVSGAYAESIIRAIDSCTHFIVILSQNSMMSEHVLNEIDVAFQRLPNDIKFKPLRIDDSALSPSVKYYLSRQNWMNAFVPPLEARLNEFVKKVMEDL